MRYISKSKFLALTVFLTLLFSFALSYAKATSRNLSDAVVRLHILANSNSKTDQALKLMVRDRILSEASFIFDEATTPARAKELAEENLSFIKAVANDEIRRQGFDYEAEVSFGSHPFPTKVYGDIALPSGKYNALRVEIGEAKGENWWCVMYPPFCFTNGVVTQTEKSKDLLRQNLSPSDYELVTNQDDLPVTVRFKIVEIFQNFF